jgi:CheY-like chemotaxis protein
MENATAAHILVVDDDPVARLLAGRLLQRGGYRVTYAEEARDAIRRAELEAFDAVLMDIHLPETSGLAATRRLRDKGVRTFIVGLTGDSAVASGGDWSDAGMDACLRKPFRLGEFNAALARQAGESGPPASRSV